MKTWRYAVATGLLMGLGACSNMMGGGGGMSHSAAATQPTVAPAMVKQVQSKLRDAGYYKQGAVDGVWGAGTEQAVRAYQRDHNLTTNGQLDVPTLQALNVANSSNTNPNANNADNNNTNTNTNTNAGQPTQPMNTNSNPPPADSNMPPPSGNNGSSNQPR